MPDNVNFLAKQQLTIERRDQTDKKSLFFVIALLVVIALVFGGVWWINRSYQDQVSALESEKNRLEQRILQNNNQEIEYLTFYEKVRKLAELIEKRSHGTKALVDSYRYFTTLDTAVTASIYDYYTQNLELVLASDDVFSLPKLFQMVQDAKFTADYQAVELISMTRSIDGVYKLTVSLEL